MKKALVFPPILAFFAVTLALELLVRSELLNAALFPAPTDIFKVLIEQQDDFLIAFKETFLGVLKGFCLSVLVGLSFAVLFSLNSFLRRSILPFAIFFQTVPIIAVAPLLVIYFGFGEPTVIAASFIVSIFPIIANTLVGLDSVQKNYLELFKVYKASRFQTLIHLKLPSAYLSIITGIRVSAGLSVIGAVAGEFVAGGGLGAIIDSATTQQRVDMVFTAILLLTALGLMLIGLVNILNWSFLKWRPLI